MAEARSEEEEENTMREEVGRRGRPDRRKPEQRHSQGPLSSIRAAIKRTSNRSTSLSETPRDRDRERDRERDRDRDRRRPEITILSAEPLASTSLFPGASGGFPPPPPPAAQIWGPTIPPSIQPPPSYEEVIREKTQEQVLLPPSSSPSSGPTSRPVSTITIATQTDTGPAPDPPESHIRRPVRPPRPPLPYPPKSSHVDTVSTSQSTLQSLDSVAQNTDLLTEPSTSTSGAQTDHWDQCFTAVDAALPPAASSHVPLERPRPRPRSKLGVRPVSCEVKVQTLVKLREDGLATLASRAGSDGTNQDVSQGKYLQELLEAFSSDDWGFPDRRSDSSGLSQSENEEEEEEEDMATLRARIQAFEQQVADGNCGDGNTRQSGATEGFVVAKKPEPQPRPRLQVQPAKTAPPVVAPKPKSLSHGPKPSTKVFWEDGGFTSEPSGADSAETNAKAETVSEPSASSSSISAPSSPSQPTEKQSATPKPQPATETLSSGTRSPASAPVPAPRPPPPKLASSPTNPKPPPRPAVAPRASMGAPQQDKSTSDGRTTPTLPPRPSMEAGGGAQTESGGEASHNTTNQTVKAGSIRPGLKTKPAVLTSPRRASAPNLVTRPAGGSLTLSDGNTTPANTAVPKPLGPALTKPPTPAPAPALRKNPKAESTNSAESSEPPLPPRPSSVKPLPLRPPPIKSIPERPPPPVITSSATQIAPPPAKTAPSVSSQTASPPPPPSVSQRAPKRGPPLPPRPKPGHPLYNNHVKQEVLIVLDDPTPSPSEPPSAEEGGHTAINPSQCLLDLNTELEPVLDQDSQSKPGLEGLSLSDSQSILPEQPAEHKEQPDPPTVSGPRCIALFDYEGEEEDELTFSQGDVIALLELIGPEWGRGQIHGRMGIFPLNFTEVVEPPPGPEPAETPRIETAPKTSQDSEEVEEWAVALFDFPGQTAEDLSFHKGALIRVMDHIDAEWCRGRLEGREGLYPAAFTQPCESQPITGVQSAGKGVGKALFEFTAENEDELTVKVGDIITQVESVDEQWILGVVGGKRGIVPKNYISLL